MVHQSWRAAKKAILGVRNSSEPDLRSVEAKEFQRSTFSRAKPLWRATTCFPMINELA